MKKLIVCFMLLGSLYAASLEEEFSVEKLSKISVEGLSKKLSSRDFSNSEKEIIASHVVKSQRADLMLLGIKSRIIWSELTEAVKGSPETQYKAKLINQVLLADAVVWGNEPTVSKGFRYRQIGGMCLNTLNHYFPDDPVDWPEISSVIARKNLSEDLMKILAGGNLPKRNKNLPSSLPSHELSLENDLSFEKGWNDDEEKVKENAPRSSLRKNNLDDQRKQQIKERPKPLVEQKPFATSPKAPDSNLSEQESLEAEKSPSRLPWIIVGLLFVGTFVVLFKRK